MPTLYERSLYGVSRTRANDGFPMSQLDGNGGGIVEVAVAFVGQNAGNSLPPSDPTITLQLFPFGAAQVGTDSSGNIGTNDTWTRTPPPKNFYTPTGGGSGSNFTDGFFGTDIRGVINIPEAQVPAGLDFIVQILCSTQADFTPDSGMDPVTDLTATDISYNEETDEGQVTLSWEDPNAETDYYLIEYSWDGGSTWNPWASTSAPTRTYTDTVYVPTTTIYRVIPVDTDTGTIPTGTPPTVEVIFTSAPDVNVTMGGGIDLGGAATLTFNGDPSGLYTIVAGKRNDTLYQREGAEATENVAIPRPYFKMGFVP